MKRGTGVKISCDQYWGFLKDSSDLTSLGVSFDLLLRRHVLSVILALCVCVWCVWFETGSHVVWADLKLTL